jgi:hypothetical protein
MSRAEAYYLVLPYAREQTFDACFEEGSPFSEAVPEFSHSNNGPLLCLVVTRGQRVAFVARGRRGMRAGTGLRRLHVLDPHPLSAPVSVSSLLPLIPGRLRKGIRTRLGKGGLLTNAAFRAVSAALSARDPEIGAVVERFGRDRAEALKELPIASRQALAYQKEAVATALSLATIDRDSLREWEPKGGSASESFLTGIPEARLREDPMIINDFMNLPGFDLIRTLPYTAALFESATTRLTVIIANRLPLEAQTGTDLIYFNEKFQCFVLVQYKAMESGARGPEFRLPNAQLDAEILRMDALLAALRQCASDSTRDGFRLHENPFFIKLCSRLVFNPDSVRLVSGMYLPLSYWRVLVSDPETRGQRGGVAVTFENAVRYFNNTELVSLIGKAWVGTTATQSIVLKDVIRQCLETGKAVTIALKQTVLEPKGETSDDDLGPRSPQRPCP